MTENNEDDAETAAPCGRCIVIRFFLMGIAGLALTYVLSPDTFRLIEGLSTLALSVIFVGAMGLLAIGKAVLESIGSKRSGD